MSTKGKAMPNTVFEAALAKMTEAMGSVEAEFNRLAGVHQNMEALRVQQRDLQQTINGLAAKIPEHKREIAEAQDEAREWSNNGKRERDRIIADAMRNAAKIVADANKQAEDIVRQGMNDAEPYAKQIAESQMELERIRGDIAAHTRLIDDAKTRFAKMREHAAAFAALE